MPIELSKEQHDILKQTARVQTPAEFQTLLTAAKPRMDQIVKEVQEANQPVPTTLTELRDLMLAIHAHQPALAAKKYDETKRAALRDAIRLLDTANAWFGEGVRTGAFRTRRIEDVLAASRPWRSRLKAFGEHAFSFDPDVAEQFADTNTSGTLQEEIDDLAMLNTLVEQHRDELTEVGLTEALVQQGKTLLEEANGRDIAGIVGLRNQAEATVLRNRILTYAVNLGREARAAGVNACFDQDDARRRFEAASFRDALRKLRPKRARTRPEEAPVPGTNATAPIPGDAPA